MDTIDDFEDLLSLLEMQKVQYLIVGGLAFIFHAKPRYTKDTFKTNQGGKICRLGVSLN